MRRLSLLALFLTCLAPLAQAQLMPLLAPPMAQPNGYRLCRPAIQVAEQRHNVPARLLAAIGRVESGRRDPETGETNPWPWAVNAEGQGFLFESKAKAISAVTEMQARGIRSIDVGCMQVNLMHHPDAFPSLAQAFDPAANADYAARFLVKLYGHTVPGPRPPPGITPRPRNSAKTRASGHGGLARGAEAAWPCPGPDSAGQRLGRDDQPIGPPFLARARQPRHHRLARRRDAAAGYRRRGPGGRHRAVRLARSRPRPHFYRAMPVTCLGLTVGPPRRRRPPAAEPRARSPWAERRQGVNRALKQRLRALSPCTVRVKVL